MTDQDFKRQLEELNVPDIGSSKHANLLRADLIRRHEQTLGLSGVLNYIKESYKQMSLIKKVSPVAAIIVVAVVFGLLNQSTPANAQDTVNKAMMRAEKLTPEQRANIESKIKADLNQSLEEAKAAPDLQIVSGEESTFGFGRISAPFGKLKNAFTFKLENKQVDGEFTGGKAVGMAVHDSAIDPANIKHMTYTNPQGQKVTLGVDENDMVVFKMIEFSEEDKQQMMERIENLKPGEASEKGFNIAEPRNIHGTFEFTAPPTDALTVPDFE
jgi:hypothetical protein